MSDIKIYNKKTKEGYKCKSQSIYDIRKNIEENAFELLGVTIIDSDISLTGIPFEKVQTLGYDENYIIVIIEYRNGKFSNVIGKGLTYIDFIKKNLGKFKMYLREKVDEETFKNLIYDVRLIVIGDDFNVYDQYSIKQVAYDIDLIKLSLYNDLIVLEKIFVSNKDAIINSNSINNEYFQRLNEFILSLGDEVVAKGNNNFIIYRKIKTFMYMIFTEQLLLKIKLKGSYKDIYIKTRSDCEKAFKYIEQSYDEN